MRSQRVKQFVAFLVSLALLFSVTPQLLKSQSQNPPSKESFVSGKFVAKNYAYQGVQVAPGTNIPSGAGTITLYSGSVTLADGRKIVPFSAGGKNILGEPDVRFPAIPITIGAGSVKETVTPTAVSGCYIGAPQFSCQITATFANAHGQGEVVTSGSAGIDEAALDAGFWGGGVVAVDPSANIYLGGASTVTAAMVAAPVIANVTLEDDRTGPPTYWSPLAGATTLAAPTTLIATTAGFGVNGANFTGGFYTGSASYITCIAYVDIFGQEGPCSATFTISTSGVATTDQIGYTAPAASTGAVGYTIYISLASGSYNLAYKVPLISQPATVGAAAVGNGVCTLTTIETVTPACALTNTSYNQTGVGAVVSALTLNTSPIPPQSTVVSTTSVYVPNAGGRTTYTYAPSASGGAQQLPSMWLPFVISAADATTVPSVIGTVNIPPQYMNVLGKTLRVCGYGTTTASTATIEEIQIQWDSVGQNTAGKGVLVGDVTAVATWATAGHIGFCEDLTTTTTSASATGGSIMMTNGWAGSSGLSQVTGGGGGGNITSTTGSLNLAADARLNIIYVHTTGTDGAAITLESLTARLL